MAIVTCAAQGDFLSVGASTLYVVDTAIAGSCAGASGDVGVTLVPVSLPGGASSNPFDTMSQADLLGLLGAAAAFLALAFILRKIADMFVWR